MRTRSLSIPANAQAGPTDLRDSARHTPANAASRRQFWSKGMRQAVAAAIDREALVERVFEGRNVPAYHMVPPTYTLATEPFKKKYGTRDLELSKRLLTSLGYKEESPLEFTLWHPSGQHYGVTTSSVLRVIKEQLEETGLIKVILRNRDWAPYVHSLLAGELPIFFIGWSPDFADPDNWLSPFASSAQSLDQGTNYSNPKMDRLLQKAAASLDLAERKRLYRQIGDIYAEEVITLPLFWESGFIVYRDGIEGVAVGAPFEFNYNVLSFGANAVPASGNSTTIIIGTTYEVQSLDANDAHARSDWEILKNTGTSLLSFKPGTSELICGAAQDFPTMSNDGQTYTFKLRKGIRFADGTPLTAQDYVYAWERYNALEGQVSGLVQVYVESVEVVDEFTVAYHLKDKFGFFPSVAATPAFIPVNPHTFTIDSLNRRPEKLDGIGAYRMASYKHHQQMVLEVNPNYFGEDKPRIPIVIIQYFPDSSALGHAVETAKIDIAWRNLGIAEATRLSKVEGVHVLSLVTPLLRYLVFNHTYMTDDDS
jgi:peptide/nickel transport system substrate-binding protein